jgi:hypothetical protein
LWTKKICIILDFMQKTCFRVPERGKNLCRTFKNLNLNLNISFKYKHSNQKCQLTFKFFNCHNSSWELIWYVNARNIHTTKSSLSNFFANLFDRRCGNINAVVVLLKKDLHA